MRLSLTLQQVLDNLFLIFCIRLNQRFRKQKFGSSSAIYYIVLGVCCPGGEDKVNCALFLLWVFFLFVWVFCFVLVADFFLLLSYISSQIWVSGVCRYSITMNLLQQQQIGNERSISS